MINVSDPQHTNEGHPKRYGSEPPIEEEQPQSGVHVEEPGHIQVVGKCGRETHNTDHALGGLHLEQVFNIDLRTWYICLF
ncbi:hypothetical protein DPMN_053054 [Dreissena polymorpha]|uniref:Uncharacterized protein n=1 Tax=Dreissena polymorpha TaxID=45954 RepID=A0A9D4CKN9_DREPO|nr:hypothetical protein DPMN_053054 [Dreissena polymorpha]